MKFKRLDCIGEGVTGLEPEPFENDWTIKQKGDNKPKYNIKVPGNVRLALMDADVISDPFIAKNNENSKWVSDVVWDYENNLNLELLSKKILKEFNNGGIAHIVFDAIDYDGTFYFNNNRVCRQIGMFSAVDIACGVIPEKKFNLNNSPNKSPNASDLTSIPIKIRFAVQPWFRTHAVKSQMAFGWDFAPEIRTIGIWKNVRTHYTGQAFFTEVFVIAKQDDSTKSTEINSDNTKVTIKGKIKILNPETMNEVFEPQHLEFQIKLADIARTIQLEVKSGVPFEIELRTTNLPIWEPWSLGEQNILPVTIKVLKDNKISDEYRGQVINRKMKWLRNPGTFPGNENWTVEINNKKMFVRGINWVPPDSLYGRIDGERYKKLIDKALEMNIDMIRVWGGGIEEKPEFYDYCDKVGMMVWQEFPFACTNYPKDPRYVETAMEECNGIVRRTRRHPSVVVYCGGNEFNPFINSHIIKIVKNAVAKYAPDRFCFEASPYLGDDHNWRVWGSRRKFEGYEINGHGPFQMLTEYGMQAAPNIETLNQCINNNDETNVSKIKEELMYHKGDINGLLQYTKMYENNCENTSSLIKVTQNLQAYGLKYAIEVCRSCWPNVSGVFPWQLSDPWPNISWSVVDYNFKPKLAYKMLKISYAPVLPMVRNWKKSSKGGKWVKGEVIIHNSTQELFQGKILIDIKRKVTDKAGNVTKEIIQSKKYQIKVSPNVPLKVKTIEVESIQGTTVKTYLFDQDGNKIISNFNFPTMEPPCPSINKIKDLIDIRFDGWWRKRMTKLMEIDRIKEEVAEYTKDKKKRDEKLKKIKI